MTDQNTPEDAIPEEESPVESVGEREEAAEPADESALEEIASADGPAATEPVRSATTATAATASKTAPEVPPYVDDPISKWWIGIIIAVFGLILVVIVLFGRGGFLSDIFESDDPTPEPAITASPEPQPTA